MKTLLLSLCAFTMVITTYPAFARTSIATDSRIRTLVYGPNEVFRIITAFGYQTNIEFPDNEDIVTISVGDPSLFSITPSGNRLFLKPLVRDRDTNVTIVTTERAYQMEFSSMTDETDQLMYVVRFFYPDEDYDSTRDSAANWEPNSAIQLPQIQNDPARGIAAYDKDLAASAQNSSGTAAMSGPPSAAFNPASDPRLAENDYENSEREISSPLLTDNTFLNEEGNVNYNYTLSGNEVFAPIRIYDDGLFTYFKFPEGIDALPDFFRVDLAQGIDVPIAIEAQNNRVRINNIYPRMTLRIGDRTICVFNESMEGTL